MENRTEHFLEEKIYCHTYDGLVREMASAMEVDSKKLFPNTEGEFDHEDIESWIGAVKFKEGKVPDIQASLSSDRGLNVIKFDVADQKGIGSLDEKATKEELVYSMALTEAKMKVISDIAEEVYPAVAFQIKDYKREIEKVREEILGDKRENTSLDEVIHGVLSKKTLAAAVIIGGMVLSACGVSVEIVTPNATATETQPRVTETVEIEVTKTPTVEATPTIEITPTAEVVTPDPLVAIEEFNLDSERTYTLSEEGYLVDSFNQAKMAKWSDKNNEWVDTSLEEKYGHLVPEDEVLVTQDIFGNKFLDDRGEIDASDRRYWNVVILVRSVGNVYQKNEYDEALEMETTNIYGGVVYRDIEGKIQLLNVRFDVVVPEAKIKRLVVCADIIGTDFDDFYKISCSGRNFVNIGTVENEVSYYNKPGELLNLMFAYERPEDDPTILHPEYFYPNYRNISNRALWDKQKDIYRKLAKAILENGEVDAPNDFIVAAQFISPFMTYQEMESLENN